MDRLQVCYQCGREMPYRKRRFGSNRFCSSKCSAIYNARNRKIKLGWFQKMEKIKRMMADGAILQKVGNEFHLSRERVRQLVASAYLDYDKIAEARKDIREAKRVLKRHILKNRVCMWCLGRLPAGAGSRYCNEICRNNSTRKIQRKSARERYRSNHGFKRYSPK